MRPFFPLCPFLPRNSVAFSSNSSRTRRSPTVQDQRRAGALPHLRVNVSPHFKMPPLGVLLHYFLSRNKGQEEISHAASLTQLFGRSIRVHLPRHGRPRASPTRGFRGVHTITPNWHALRLRSVHRGQSRHQDLLRLLSVKFLLVTQFMKLIPLRLHILGPIQDWNLRLHTVSVRRGPRRRMSQRGPGRGGRPRRQRRRI